MNDGLVTPMAVLCYIRLHFHSLEGEIQSRISVVFWEEITYYFVGRASIQETTGSLQELKMGLRWQPG